ncbi:hypothetical protein GCM10018980_32940 [Streptomyces capoamus]|uniref:Uncharacterized protein n=1 Tax=Streptomyces capoamus TaxID=68183 RepID=A0A919C4Q9_9ACTN|nr:hypothetical protein GCM10010501_03610 [Streptomyces libani subsp. rufus]GHG50919.1 hypothetical protein GCM10018980_32940 [Streptomyces capoamus]
MLYGAVGEEHDHVEVDAVDAVQGGVGVPAALGAHGADLHAHAADGQLGREGEGSDSVTLSFTSYDCHVLFVPSLSRDHCPRFTTG